MATDSVQDVKNTTPATKTRTDRDEDVTGTKVVNEQGTTMPSRFDAKTISGITSFESAIALARETYGEVVTSDGFRVADEKQKLTLCDKPTVMMEWIFATGDWGDYTLVDMVVQNDDKTVTKWRINDGSSTGVNKQLREYATKTGKMGGLILVAGMRKSRYPIDPVSRQPLSRQDQRGKTEQNWNHWSTTFYIDIPAE